MNKPTMLKWSRREKQLTQKQLADDIGVSPKLIGRLELESSEWEKLDEASINKLNDIFDGTKYWNLVESNSIEVERLDIPIENKPEERIEVHKPCNKLTKDDIKILTLIEFAYEGLRESQKHEDFVVNVNLIKRILNKYNL